MNPATPSIPPINAHTSDIPELDELRRQMAEFKTRLESQKIISERMLLNVINQRFSGIMMFVKIEAFVLLPFIALCFLFVCHFFGLSWWFYGATVAMVFFSTLFDYLINSHNDPLSSSLITIMRSIERQKRRRLIQLAVSIPIVIAWVIWYIVEIHGSGSDFPIVGIIIGAVAGAIGGSIIFFRQQRSLTRSVNDINLLLNSTDIPPEP